MYRKSKKKLKCYFCGGPHLCRDCKIERKKSPEMKKKVGKYMEKYYAENFTCIRCGSSNLKVLNDRSPSLDVTCHGCSNKLEIKSKCLSVKKLPKDIKLPHGSFQHYIKRQNTGLDFAIIIYGINRVTKEITVREIMYFLNEVINTGLIKIIPQKKSQLSEIIIKDREDPKILKLQVPKINVIDFRKRVESIIVE